MTLYILYALLVVMLLALLVHISFWALPEDTATQPEPEDFRITYLVSNGWVWHNSRMIPPAVIRVYDMYAIRIYELDIGIAWVFQKRYEQHLEEKRVNVKPVNIGRYICIF